MTSSVIFKGIGAYAPSNTVTNDDLSQRMETSDEWIRTRTGIRERRIAVDGEECSDLAVNAARAAIADAGLELEDIDAVVLATMSPDMPFPSTACLVQHKLGLRNVPAFDVSAACSGFLYALETGCGLLGNPRYKHVLVIGAEKMSTIIDWEDRATCVLFGDGAGAAVLAKSETPDVGVLETILGSDGSNPSMLFMPGGGSALRPDQASLENRDFFLKMNGREVFKHAVRVMGQTTLDALARRNLTAADVHCLIPHQANVRIIDAISTRLELKDSQVFKNVDRYGNTSAASVPIALAEARQAGRFSSGDYVLLVAFGAGLTWGASLIKWH